HWYREAGLATDDARAGDALLGLALAAKDAGIDPELALHDTLRRIRVQLSESTRMSDDGSTAE
ncbi:MAG: hypothetical protein OXG38_11870, partial [Chloroflexi bacterium]|nr:hypothetical protein [Chloroflexota bacterium]